MLTVPVWTGISVAVVRTRLRWLVLQSAETFWLTGVEQFWLVPPKPVGMCRLSTIPGAFILKAIRFTGTSNVRITLHLPREVAIRFMAMQKINALALTSWLKQLTGSIPPELGNLTRFAVLLLSGNQPTGSIPLSFTISHS
jgi:hypothetical protein